MELDPKKSYTVKHDSSFVFIWKYTRAQQELAIHTLLMA